MFAGVVAWFADRFGRRIALQTGCALVVIAAIIQTAAQNLGMFIAARFIIGVGIEFCMVPSPVLTTELAYPTHRAKFTSLGLTFYFVGAILSSWTTYATYRMDSSTWTWRIPSLLQLAIPSLQFIVLFWVPESPRWLVGKGRVEEARAFLVKYHANGDEDSPLVEHEMQDIQQHMPSSQGLRLTWQQVCILFRKRCQPIPLEPRADRKQLWKTAADRKRLVLVIYLSFLTQWCGNGVVSYYLSLILDTVGITGSRDKTLINGILQIVSWLAAIIGSLLVDRLGRRPLWLFSIGGMLVSYTAWTICSALYTKNDSPGLAKAVLVLIFLFQVYYSVGITPLSQSESTKFSEMCRALLILTHRLLGGDSAFP